MEIKEQRGPCILLFRIWIVTVNQLWSFMAKSVVPMVLRIGTVPLDVKLCSDIIDE